jgi:peptidoglycan/xylan/chitin deacetylase (PgdA/CDA1 family)
MTSAARMLKEAGVWTLAHGGAPRIARWAQGDALFVLTYHNVVPTRDDARQGEASLHIDQATFADQLDQLCETHDVVSVADVLNGCRWRGNRPRALITFDDAYRGAVTLGVEELAKRRLEATIFVAPGLVACGGFWWDALAAPYGGEIPHSLRQSALFEYGGADERIREWVSMTGLPTRSPGLTQCCATIGELRAAARVPGITFASHSWSHPVLSGLAADALRVELGRPLRWLRETLGDVLPALAVPYGLSSRLVEREARRQGYAVVFPGTRGWIRARALLPFALPRQNVPAGLSRTAFLLRSSGLPT